MLWNGVLRIACPVLVVASLAYAQFGFFLRFETQRKAIQRSIKDRVRKGIPKDELTPFVMSVEEWQAIEWVKPKREFRLPNGDMYDVVHITIQNGQVDALCVHDKEEAVLFAGLELFVKGKLDGPDRSRGARVRVTQFVNQLYFPPIGVRMLLVVGEVYGLPGFTPKCSERHLRVPTPPPRA